MEFFESLDINLVEIGFRLLLVFFVIIIGRWFAGTSRKLMLKSLQKTDLTESLNTLITTLTYYIIMLLTVVVVLAILGVPITALVTGVGVILVILAITLQASLGNLAATVNFLLFKPFEVGHVIETNSIIGVVQEIQIFSTVLVSLDEKIQILPNSAIQNAGLTNYSKNGIIRVDLLFGIGYESDIDKAKRIIEGLLKADGRVLQTPIPLIFVRNLGESTVDIAVWPYVELANFFPFQTDITEKVKKAFDQAGISIPFPQRDVHMRLLKVKA